MRIGWTEIIILICAVLCCINCTACCREDSKYAPLKNNYGYWACADRYLWFESHKGGIAVTGEVYFHGSIVDFKVDRFQNPGENVDLYFCHAQSYLMTLYDTYYENKIVAYDVENDSSTMEYLRTRKK